VEEVGGQQWEGLGNKQGEQQEEEMEEGEYD